MDDDDLVFWKAIPLTKGQRTIVDVADLDRLAAHEWHASGPVQSTGKFYANTKIRPVPGGPQKNLLLHRFLLGATRGQEVDHINGDTLDNRRLNIRLGDRRLNQNNRKDHGKWGPGIDQFNAPADRPFRARVFLGGKLRHVGYFATAEEARAARARFLESKGKRAARARFLESKGKSQQ